MTAKRQGIASPATSYHDRILYAQRALEDEVAEFLAASLPDRPNKAYRKLDHLRQRLFRALWTHFDAAEDFDNGAR